MYADLIRNYKKQQIKSYCDNNVKKNQKEYNKLTEEFYKATSEKGIDQKFAHYVWDVLIAMSKGYGFNQSHTLAYSLIALQEMNLAYRFPIIFWNTACLISDAGGSEIDEEDDEEAIEESKTEEKYIEEMDWFDDDEDTAVSSYDEDDGENGFPATIITTTSGKKKKKLKATNYGRVATAIGRIQSEGVIVAPPDINKSSFTFTPDVDSNAIRFGLAGITRISGDLIKDIIKNRPYNSIDDFCKKVKCNKTQIINLLKSGAFDAFGDREVMMNYYIDSIADKKNAINLRNLQALINYNLLPDEFNFAVKCFNFNKYLKALKVGDYYKVDSNVERFYSDNFSMDDFRPDDDGFKLPVSIWEKHWKEQQAKLRPWIKANERMLMETINKIAFNEIKDKYAEGTISKWEMDSLSCYIHPHELSAVDLPSYGLDEFCDISERPCVERYIPIKGKQVPIFKLYRIAGTVLDRNKTRKIVTLLTTSGVVTVKIYGVFAEYDRQISERGADGKKHIIEKSMFARGNKIIVTGIREDDTFIAKTYTRTPYHKVEQITNIIDNELVIKTERAGE